jgi:hypothetical protein
VVCSASLFSIISKFHGPEGRRRCIEFAKSILDVPLTRDKLSPDLLALPSQRRATHRQCGEKRTAKTKEKIQIGTNESLKWTST